MSVTPLVTELAAVNMPFVRLTVKSGSEACAGSGRPPKPQGAVALTAADDPI